MIKNLQDFLAGLLFVALGIGFGWAASGHVLGSADNMGPGFVPLLLGLLLGMLGLLILFKALTFEALGSGRVRHWGLGSLWRVLGGLLWLALCSGPAQWPWVGAWFAHWPTFGLAVGVLGLVLSVMVGGERGGWNSQVWLWSLALAAVVCAVWVGPLGLDVPLWPRRPGT
ncbi:hypothetical protein [Hydrogenophaga sp.]|uniref:hypothetical protein n=1 Tax=Hydrogenophaga sp. TaxID=1904254 RepID=UPI002718BFE8|nr:hypothetical protein [Hydrogenophaga sp.]MDO9434037.1 hypothetical protein [Hydrogenophaga sp.]